MERIQNYINGKLADPVGDKFIENYDPAIGKVYSLIPDSDERDVNNAAKAAEVMQRALRAELVRRQRVLPLQKTKSIRRHHVVEVSLTPADRAIALAHTGKVCPDFELDLTAMAGPSVSFQFAFGGHPLLLVVCSSPGRDILSASLARRIARWGLSQGGPGPSTRPRLSLAQEHPGR